MFIWSSGNVMVLILMLDVQIAMQILTAVRTVSAEVSHSVARRPVIAQKCAQTDHSARKKVKVVSNEIC
ncbi:hypothetical protein KFK09_015662 [Dendrobium nobile]|uniref:Secreted protein n=1 Tax=Dendrobium nobile TaxID=94219 RepID=A0A8T3B7I0_DENNO|nr:hypothetical protein KFK09_015662 [Dendrobium nobile]